MLQQQQETYSAFKFSLTEDPPLPEAPVKILGFCRGAKMLEERPIWSSGIHPHAAADKVPFLPVWSLQPHGFLYCLRAQTLEEATWITDLLLPEAAM